MSIDAKVKFGEYKPRTSLYFRTDDVIINRKAMPNGFLAITEWFSVSVLILLGAATLSTGTYGLMHDKNLSETSSDSLCHLRCAKDASKVKEIIQI